MAKPVSISARELTAAAKVSVAKALDQHKAAFPGKPDIRIGFVPPHWWFGFVLDNAQVEKLTFGSANKLAVEVHHGIAGSMPSLKAGKPGAILGHGHTTIGFLPPIEIELIEE